MVYSDKKSLLKCIGNNIKFERVSRQLTIQQLADILELSPQMIKSIENGTRGTTIENLIKIADIFNMTLDELVGRNISELKFCSPENEDNNIIELQALCSTLNAEQTALVLNFVKNLIVYTNDIAQDNE